MATPILDYITDSIVSTLAGVTTGNGYNYTLTVVEPNPATGDKVVDKQCVLAQGDSSDHGGASYGFAELDQQYIVFISALYSGTVDTVAELREKLNTMASDAAKALRYDATRGGLARDTTVSAPSIDLLAGEAGGRAMLTVNVWYSTKDTDPFTQ